MPKSETHWYYKPLTYNFCLLPLFFCISYPDIDDEYIMKSGKSHQNIRKNH